MELVYPSAAFRPEEGIAVSVNGMLRSWSGRGGNHSVQRQLRDFVATVTTDCTVSLKYPDATSPRVPAGSQQSPVI